jgi:hypothetical protein
MKMIDLSQVHDDDGLMPDRRYKASDRRCRFSRRQSLAADNDRPTEEATT